MIRSLTIGAPIYSTSKTELMEQLSAFRVLSESHSQASDLTTRTTRLTLPPPRVDAEAYPGALRSVVDSVRDLAEAAGARWYCMPLDLFEARGRDALLAEAQALVVRDTKLFVNLIVADTEAISMEGARRQAASY